MNRSVKKVLNCTLLLLAFLLILGTSVTALAHSGGTDKNGGHNCGGIYHYHHGYPAHDHIDGDGDGEEDCPYNFRNNTAQNFSSSDKKVSIPITKQPAEGVFPIVPIIITAIIALLILAIPRYFLNEDAQASSVVAKILAFTSSVFPLMAAFLILCLTKGELCWAVLSAHDIFTAFLISAGLSFALAGISYFLSFYLSILLERLFRIDNIIPSYSDSYAFAFALLMIYQLIQ